MWDLVGNGSDNEAAQIMVVLFVAANGEIHDLRIIMDSADKELKEYKEKVKAREAVMMGLESKVS